MFLHIHFKTLVKTVCIPYMLIKIWIQEEIGFKIFEEIIEIKIVINLFLN